MDSHPGKRGERELLPVLDLHLTRRKESKSSVQPLWARGGGGRGELRFRVPALCSPENTPHHHPTLHTVTAQTQLTGGGGAAMTQSRAVQQIPLNLPGSRPRVQGLLPLGRQSPFKSSLCPAHPSTPVLYTHQHHPPPPSSTPLFSPPQPEGLLSPPVTTTLTQTPPLRRRLAPDPMTSGVRSQGEQGLRKFGQSGESELRRRPLKEAWACFSERLS
ncbi:unnamed protein product [Pleuronectes platessa]|uniref:Uncharacterized protein n=1 Tax=Pleuronectes platessa TaxID=8262 RepID=A0A9N7VUB0_PLEPL|nr:unnamed protein product [Pleuronectes platessa]